MRKFYDADFTVGGRVELDAGDGIKSLKDLKKEIREAEASVIAMSQKFGETSVQARAAAKRAAELKDAIGDAKQLVDAFNPDKKFASLAQSLNGVLGGFSALTGAMGLLGVESEDVQKQLLKVQSALALSQGINQIGESINSFKNLGKTIVATLGRNGLIGLAIAGVAALGAALSGVFSNKLSASQKALNDSLKEFGKASDDARASVVKVQAAFKSAEAGVISKKEALKQYNETLGDTFGKTNDLSVAEDRVARNAEAYIRITGLKAQANALFAKSAEASNRALAIQRTLEGTKGIVADQLRKELVNTRNEASEIDALIQNIFTDINKLQSQGGNLFGGLQDAAQGIGKGKATTPGGKLKEKEVEEISGLQKLLNQIAGEQAAEEARLNDIRTAGVLKTNETITVSNNATTLSILENKRKENEALALQQYYETTVANARVQAIQSVGNALGALSELIGKQTAAGKVLAIAQATINMWLGVTEVLRNKTVLPEPFGTINKIASITTVIATGLSAIKNIVKTQVPGASGGSAPVNSVSISSPVTPRPNNQTTMLDQQSLNAIGNAANRAFVLEHDVTTNQERIRRLNRAARI